MNSLLMIPIFVLFQSCSFFYAASAAGDFSNHSRLNSVLNINLALMQKCPTLKPDTSDYHQEFTKFQNHQKDRLQKMNLAYTLNCKWVLKELLQQAIASNKLYSCDGLSKLYREMLTSSDYSFLTNTLKDDLLVLQSAIYCLPDEEFSQTVLGYVIDLLKKSHQPLSHEECLSLISEAARVMKLVKRTTPELESLDDIIKYATRSCIFIAQERDYFKPCQHLIKAYQNGGSFFQENILLLENSMREIEIREDLQEIKFQFLQAKDKLSAQRSDFYFSEASTPEKPFLDELLIEDVLSVENFV